MKDFNALLADLFTSAAHNKFGVFNSKYLSLGVVERLLCTTFFYGKGEGSRVKDKVLKKSLLFAVPQG